MKKIPRIKRAFQNMSDAAFNEFAQGVLNSLDGNDLFPDIAAELAVFKAAYDKYFTSIPAHNIRNSVNTATKNANKEAAVRALTKLSLLVEYQADFSLEALESSGFELVSKRRSKGLVGMVQNVGLNINGIEGMVIVQCNRAPNATTYKARVSTDQENWLWVNACSTRVVKVHNVPTGVPVFVLMQLENAQGFSPWSDSVTGVIPTHNLITSIHE